LPRRLKAAAGPSPDPRGYDCDPDTEVISIPAATEVKDSSIRLLSLFSDVSKYRDPLHLLLNYIAEVSTAGSLHPTIQYIPDLDVNYAASI
jgi:hypothetical protein